MHNSDQRGMLGKEEIAKVNGALLLEEHHKIVAECRVAVGTVLKLGDKLVEAENVNKSEY